MFEHICLTNRTCIIRFDIQKVNTLFGMPELGDYSYKVFDITEASGISEFYKKFGYTDFSTQEKVEKQYEEGNVFHGIVLSNRVVAGLWIHEGIVDIKAPRFEALKKKHKQRVKFSDDTIYSSHNLVDKEFRGNHLYSRLLISVINSYRDKKINYIIITGENNQKMINSSIKYLGQIIGFATTTRLIRFIWIHSQKLFYPGEYWTNI